MKKLVATCAILGVFYLINIKQHIIKDAVLLMPLIFELYKVQLKNEQVDDKGNTALIWACKNGMKEVAYELVSIGAFTINDIMSLKPEWVPEELFIIKPVDVTEIDI